MCGHCDSIALSFCCVATARSAFLLKPVDRRPGNVEPPGNSGRAQALCLQPAGFSVKVADIIPSDSFLPSRLELDVGMLYTCVGDMFSGSSNDALVQIPNGHQEISSFFRIVPVCRHIAGRRSTNLNGAPFPKNIFFPTYRYRQAIYPNPLRNLSSALRVLDRSRSRSRLDTAYLSQRFSTAWIRRRFSYYSAFSRSAP